MRKGFANCLAGVFVLGLLSGCADRLLLYPSAGPVDAKYDRREWVDAGGKRVEVIVALSPGAKERGEAKVLVLEFCGNATRAETIAQYVADRWEGRPVEVWVMNYPGFGGSDEPATLNAIAPAALKVYDAMAARANGRPIVVSGSSLGTAAALYVARERHAAGMVMQNPPPLQRMILQKYGWVVPAPIVAQIPKELDSLENARHVTAPAVIILAGRDTTVPPEYQKMVADAYAGEKHFVEMPEANHNAPIEGEDRDHLERELTWLWSRLAN